MTHEWYTLWKYYLEHAESTSFVLASVVHLEGSSYRRPGVRMLIDRRGNRVGAVSGGCVEKEVQRQCEIVFETGKSRMMQYDGRYRLGCEGVLHLLLEPFAIPLNQRADIQKCFDERLEFELSSLYSTDLSTKELLGSTWSFGDTVIGFNGTVPCPKKAPEVMIFREKLFPRPRLVLFGGEHDAVVFAKMATVCGYEVGVITDPKEGKSKLDFPHSAMHTTWSTSQSLSEMEWKFDHQTSIMVMSHNFARDLAFLAELQNQSFSYLGILGPAHRREKMTEALFEHFPETSADFPDQWHSPAGLDLGAENPSEIALSVLSEMLMLQRGHRGGVLKEKKGRIHSDD